MTRTKRSANVASKRQLRVGEELRHIIASILAQNLMHDPDLANISITVTEVKPSPDMRNATVYVTPLGGKNEEVIITALNRCAGFVQVQMGRQLSMKFTPRLSFKADESFEYASHIEDLIRKSRRASGDNE